MLYYESPSCNWRTLLLLSPKKNDNSPVISVCHEKEAKMTEKGTNGM